MKKQVRDFKERMNGQNQYHANDTAAQAQTRNQTSKKGDYIDFEEIR
jgi:hypothetical protein